MRCHKFFQNKEMVLIRAARNTWHQKLFKTLNYLNPSYLWDLFNVKPVEYNLRTENLVILPQIKTQTHGVNSITFRGSILWNALSDDIKTCDNVVAFKKKVIAWKGEICSCRLCR